MIELNINYLCFFILIIGTVYFYNNINSKQIPDYVVKIYNNSLFKILFLLFVYIFGNYNIFIILFLVINYISIGQLIQNNQLLNDIIL